MFRFTRQPKQYQPKVQELKEILLESNGSLEQNKELLSLVQNLAQEKNPTTIIIRFPKFSTYIDGVNREQAAHLTLKFTAEMCGRYISNFGHSIEIRGCE